MTPLLNVPGATSAVQLLALMLVLGLSLESSGQTHRSGASLLPPPVLFMLTATSVST